MSSIHPPVTGRPVDAPSSSRRTSLASAKDRGSTGLRRSQPIAWALLGAAQVVVVTGVGGHGWWLLVGLVRGTQVAFDRALGYGLRTPAGFQR